MQSQAGRCSLLDRRKRIQSFQRNDPSGFLQQRTSLSGGEMRAGMSGDNYRSRPMPPLLGNGETVDLLKLFVHVKKRGGHDTITRDGLWEDVGEDQGLRSSGFGTAIKLIYYKYFLMSQNDLTNITGAVDSEGEALYPDLGLDESDLMRFASRTLKERKNNEEGSEEGSTDGGKMFGGKNDTDSNEVEVVEIDSVCSDLSDNEMGSINLDVSKPEMVNDMVKVAKISSNVKMFSGTETGVEEEKMVEDLTATEGEGSTGKRKRECALSKMLAWLNAVAKDPPNLGIGTLPESTNWKSYETDHCWKQVLLTRGVLFHKKPHDSSPEQFPCQINMVYKAAAELRGQLTGPRYQVSVGMDLKKQKIHPSMFDDAEKIRSSPRLHLVGSLGTSVNHISSLSSFNLRKRIPLGPCFQAQLPEWTGVPAESESKWLGTRIWPHKDKSLVYPPLQDYPVQILTTNHATREFLCSVESVRTHVSLRRMKLKLELGSAFDSWRFDKMGEGVAAASWSKKEEKRFSDVVRENPWSQGKRFWNEMSKTLPGKTWEELVNYYFNVFLLRRRAQQNRRSMSSIDSDDDET